MFSSLVSPRWFVGLTRDSFLPSKITGVFGTSDPSIVPRTLSFMVFQVGFARIDRKLTCFESYIYKQNPDVQWCLWGVVSRDGLGLGRIRAPGYRAHSYMRSVAMAPMFKGIRF